MAFSLGIEKGDVGGKIPLAAYPLNFTLMSHAGFSGVFFGTLWVWWNWQSFRSYSAYILALVIVVFFLMMAVSPQFANNITTKKLTIRPAEEGYDWLYYARIRISFLLVIFSVNGSVLIWASGGLSSPFIPFYVMVFTLALNYCSFPHPLLSLTLTFVGFFFVFTSLAEFAVFHHVIAPPIDPQTQAAIDSSNSGRFFEGAFVVASMIVPWISMMFSAWRGGDHGASGNRNRSKG